MELTDELKNIHKESIDAFALVEDNEREDRELAIEDMLFVDSPNGQWDEHAQTVRKGRPMYTIDLVSEVLRQIIGDQRQSRTRIKVDPNGGGADKDTAGIFDGLIRKIEKDGGRDAYDNAFKEQLKGGYGGWRILTKYNDDSFDQDIYLEPIYSAVTSLYYDADANRYDKSDAKKAWLVTEMSEDEFKEAYPDANITNFNDPSYKKGSYKCWFNGTDKIRIAEYWRAVPCIRHIGLLSDGRTIDLGEEENIIDELEAKGITVVKERKTQSYKIEMYKMNGAEILEGPHAWAGKYIPLIPVYGEVSHVNGKTFVHGKVRKAKDAAQIYNYSISAKIEATALSPKDPVFATEDMVDGHESEFETMNTANAPVVKFSLDPSNPSLTPFRLGAPQLQQALIEQTQQASKDVHSAMGMHDPALGNGPQLLSEKSLMSQAELGDRGAYEYRDNLDKAKEYTGKVLVDLIPRIYDTPRIIQVLNVDGSIEEHEINQINQTVMDEQTKDPVIVNDLSKGKYSVSIETGPAYATLRDETVQQLTDLSAANPMFANVSADLIAKNMNITEADELTKRIRKILIPQGIADPTDEEKKKMGLDKPQKPDPNQQALIDNVNMQTEQMMSDIEGNDAKTQETLVNTQVKAVDAYNKLLDAFEKQVSMGVPLSSQQRALLVKQGDIVADAQDITQEGEPNSEQAADLAAQLAAGTIRAEDLQ